MLLNVVLILSPLLAFLPSASAHGYLSKVVIDSTTYVGNIPGARPTDSPIRQISDNGPVKGAQNPDLNCGLGAKLATTVVPANPGSVVQFLWSNAGQGNWVHNTGPIMTYLGACDGSTCDKFNGSTAKWFKIDQLGKKTDGSWYQQDVMKKEPVFVTLPDNLSPGGYLVRHEIIALQLAVSVGGAEFYPSCTQILVGGSKTGTPDQTVSFPGAYGDNDPGIYDPNVYDATSPYVFPGPPVSNLASPNSGSGTDTSSGSPATNGPSSNGSGTTAANKPTSTTNGSGAGPTSRPSSSGAICTLKKRDTSLTRRGMAIAQDRHRVGFMRAIRDAFHHS